MTVAEIVTPPAHLWIPPGARGTYGDEVADIAVQLGRPCEGWQRIAVDAINSYGAGGRWLALENGVIVPRQNGKSLGIALPTVIADCLLWPDPDRVLWSTHRADTYRETFDLVQQLVEEHAWLSAQVSRVIDNHDEARVEWTNGSLLEFKVRSPGAGRGLGGRTVVIDETLVFPSSDAGALLPVMGRRANPRVLYLSSACKLTSAQLAGLVVRGRAGGDVDLIWCEWCARGSLDRPGCATPKCRHRLGAPGCALDDPDLQREANPAVGAGKMRPAVLRAFRKALAPNPTEFAREHLGWHEDAAAAAGETIPLAAWRGRVDESSGIVGQRVISVDVSPDQRTAAVGGAGHRGDGDVHLALVDHRAGTGWAVARVLALLQRDDVSCVVVDEGGPAAALIPDLLAAGLTARDQTNPAGEILRMSTRDAGAAAGILRARVVGDEDTPPSVWHRGDQAAQDAIAGARRRNIGNGGWGFDRRTSEDDITPIVAMAQALWGLVKGGAVGDVAVYGDGLEDGEGRPGRRQDRVAEAAADQVERVGGYQFAPEPEPDEDQDDEEDQDDDVEEEELKVTAWVG